MQLYDTHTHTYPTPPKRKPENQSSHRTSRNIMCLKSNKYNSSCNSMLKSILPSFTCKRTETHFNNLVFLFSPGWTIAMLRPMCDAYMSLQNCKHSCHMLSHTTPNITLQFNNTKQCTAVTTLTNYICTEPIKRFGYTKLKQHV